MKSARFTIAVLCVLFCAALADGQDATQEVKQEGKPATATAASRAVSLTTIHDEKIRAPMIAIAEGKLRLATEPERLVPLDEIDRIEFDKPSAAVANLLGQAISSSKVGQMLAKAAPRVPSARWLGQDNHDLARPEGSEGANGIQDMHLQLTGLPSDRKLTQVIVEQGQSIWRLDPSGTPNWKLVVVRKDGADTADLYAEPSRGDRNGQEFKITIAFDNGTTISVSVKATSATSNELKAVEGRAPSTAPASGAASDPLAVVVHLEDSGTLGGKLEALGKESLRLTTPSGGSVEVPLLQARGVWFQSAGDGKGQQQFNQRLQSPGNDDAAFVRAEDQTLTEIAGQVLDMREQKLQFKYEGETRSINIARMAGLVFAAHPKTAATDRPYQIFEFAGGNQVSGSWTALADGVLEMRLAWGATLKIPQATLASIAFRNGKLVYLSDLAPTSVEEVPYFDRTMPYQRDKNLLGEPLKVNGKEHRKGLAVHSRSVLNYALEGKYAQFRSLVGFDESVPARGRVVCRVLGDGKELFTEKDLRADAKPRPLEIGVKGVKQLTLEVDFGEDENICDRVIWADARLYRE